MQPYFQAATNKRVIANCKRELLLAMKKRAGIIFVQYYSCGETNKSLLKLTAEYDRSYAVSKSADDGSAEIHDAIIDYRLSALRLKICGVNTDCCVSETVRGLTARMPRATIEVISDACHSDYDHHGGLKRMKGFENVSIKE